MFTELLWALERLATLSATIDERPRVIKAWAVINGLRVSTMLRNKVRL